LQHRGCDAIKVASLRFKIGTLLMEAEVSYIRGNVPRSSRACSTEPRYRGTVAEETQSFVDIRVRGEQSCLSTVQRVARNVKRWREGNQPLRWTATGLLEAEKKFRRIKGYQEILVLKERLNPPRIQQKEVRTLEVA